MIMIMMKYFAAKLIHCITLGMATGVAQTPPEDVELKYRWPIVINHIVLVGSKQ